MEGKGGGEGKEKVKAVRKRMLKRKVMTESELENETNKIDDASGHSGDKKNE